MKINRKFNSLTYSEYIHLIDHHKKFTDFNILGLFRAIIESTKLTLEQKIQVRDYGIGAFRKTFDFLQLKDPAIYFELSTLGKTLTEADGANAWENIRRNQQKILEEKKLNHRNFGTYSKHHCGYDTCPFNGLMIRKGSRLAEREMHFCSDKRSYALQVKSEQRTKERKTNRQIIAARLADE